MSSTRLVCEILANPDYYPAGRRGDGDVNSPFPNAMVAVDQPAIENIKQAIEEYLAVVDGELKGATIREVEVAA